MSEKIDLSDIEELDINYIELDPEYQVESDSNTFESDKDTDISDEEEDSIAIFSRKKHVQEVHYATVPIEYPKTSEYGVATVYNITEERKKALKERELQICVQEAAARKALAEAEAMELINLEKKKSLGLL
ncbi:unnamed protein product [Rhizophagus irregularis]|uniref:Uncharacterized protein n=1 Tax=Rhizophagus irregularis TaxID=588596 RepID=A0A915YVN3_9GLOM|nr:unnamed protein product [Rhizophagus irregularis]